MFSILTQTQTAFQYPFETLLIISSYSPKWRWHVVIFTVPRSGEENIIVVSDIPKQWDNIAQKDDFNSFIPVTITIVVGSNSPRELLDGEWQRILGVWLANQSAPSNLFTVFLYAIRSYLS